MQAGNAFLLQNNSLLCTSPAHSWQQQDRQVLAVRWPYLRMPAAERSQNALPSVLDEFSSKANETAHLWQPFPTGGPQVHLHHEAGVAYGAS